VTNDHEAVNLRSADEIEMLLRHSGANAPEVDRLARVVIDMHHIEWKLARRRIVQTDDSLRLPQDAA
jgi:hypothetical protein